MRHTKITLLFLICVAAVTTTAFGQTSVKTIAAGEITAQIANGKAVNYENVSVVGDLDLSTIQNRTNDAVYPEKDRTAKVFSAKITQPMTFKNVVFTGKVDFFRTDSTAVQINEYRLVFADAVKFESCTFIEPADFELTNFDGGVSFANSVFKAKPSFIRVGLEKTPNFTNTIFENGSVFQNFQNDEPRNFSAAELSAFYGDYLKSRN